MQSCELPICGASLRIAVVAGLLSLGACGPSNDIITVESARLPVSVNEVMASLINHAADPIWMAAWQNPQSDRDWRELEHLSRQLQIGGTLLTLPGTGIKDDTWTSAPDWRIYAKQLSTAAAKAQTAASSRDVELIAKSGDEIVEVCEACHKEFKPDLPTMNIYGELSPHQ